MHEHGIENYSLSVGAYFVSTCHCQGEVRHQERETIRSVQVLDDMLQLGYIRKVCVTPVHHPLDGDIGKDMEKLISHLTNLRRSKTTIKDYRLYISEFFIHLNASGVKLVSDIADNRILTFVSSYPTNKVNIVSALRVLFRFWKQEHIVDDRYDELFDTYKARKRERVPSYFTATEVLAKENNRREILTREGITYILLKYAGMARTLKPDLIPERISCHSLRHSRAMHLLQAGVNLVYIRNILGHVSIQTTDIYARTDSKAKREALEKAYTDLTPNNASEKVWEGNKKLKNWLKDLSR